MIIRQLSSGGRFRATCASLECIRPRPLVNLMVWNVTYIRMHMYGLCVHLYHIIYCRSWNGKMYSSHVLVERNEEKSKKKWNGPLSISATKINDPNFINICARYFIIGIIYDKFMITFWRIMCTLHTKINDSNNPPIGTINKNIWLQQHSFTYCINYCFKNPLLMCLCSVRNNTPTTTTATTTVVQHANANISIPLQQVYL